MTSSTSLGSTAWLAEEQENPYSLPIIVRVEKDAVFTEADVFQAVTTAMFQLTTTPNPEWEESLTQWMSGKFRKVVRKARGAAWTKVLDSANHIHVTGDNGVELAVFEPHPVNSTPEAIRKLQVQGVSFPTVEPVESLTADNIVLTVALNPDLVMSSGKMVAQVAHATQLVFLQATSEQKEAWVNAGSNVKVVTWETAPNLVEIVDAGLTEIPAGSFTVKAGWV